MDKPPITSFTGKYRFLSNFYFAPVTLDGMLCPSVEHAFQAAKTLHMGERRKVIDAQTPGIAKRMGRAVELRPDWEDIKIDVMRDLVKQKFISTPALASKLLETSGSWLIEGNNWGDKFWGVCNESGEGLNWLGKILMELRDELEERQ